MNENKHTPEPWSVGVSKYKGELHFTAVPVGNEGKITALCGLAGANDEDESIANARRITACVNACAGFSTETLELIASVGGMQHKMTATAAVASQRDELLAAIEKMLDALVISVPMAFAAAIQNMDIEDDDAEEIHAIGAALAEEIPDDGRTVRETLRFLTTALSIAQSTIARVKGEQ